MSCLNNFNNLDLKHTIQDTLKDLKNYATISGNANSNIYAPNDDLNILFSDDFKNKFSNIDYNLNTINGKENLINFNSNTSNIYENCAIKSGVPWFSSINNNCEVIKNIELDNKFVYSTDRKSIIPNFKSKDSTKPAFCSHYSNINIAYCENRWYDWIITPNYYLGNTYFKDASKYKDNDVYKCYKPCSNDYMPYKTDKGEMKCIPKKYYNGGIYNNKYMYNAYGLINLIGNVAMNNTLKEKGSSTRNLIYNLYFLLFKYKHANSVDTTIYNINTDITAQIENFGNIQSDIYSIYNEFIEAIDKNIIEPFSNTSFIDYLTETNNFTYKSLIFNENEKQMYSLNGLFVNNLLSPPILIHTWILANLFQPLNVNILDKWKNDSKKAFDNYYVDILPEQNNDILCELLCEKLVTIYKEKNNDNKTAYDKAIRLKNIFFKAINICYNNKSNFSANIIAKTKDALQNKDLINIIKNNNLYINSDTKNQFINNLDTILDYTSLDKFVEFKFYKDNELDDLLKSYPTCQFITKRILGGTKDDCPNKYKYFYSMERLEKPSCPINTTYNTKSQKCEKNTNTISTPPPTIDNIGLDTIDNSFNIPKLTRLISVAIQIILTIIILYIFYVFYDMLIENILSIFNWGYIALWDIWYGLLIGNMYDYSEGDEASKLAEKRKKLANQLKYIAEKEYNISRKKELIENYMTENNKLLEQAEKLRQ